MKQNSVISESTDGTASTELALQGELYAASFLILKSYELRVLKGVGLGRRFYFLEREGLASQCVGEVVITTLWAWTKSTCESNTGGIPIKHACESASLLPQVMEYRAGMHAAADNLTDQASCQPVTVIHNSRAR